MRKLPVFLVIDVSESVAGSLQEAITRGIEAIVRALRSDPQSLETVHLSIIVFAGRAKVLVPMMEITQFHYPPTLPIGGGTSLGAALELLMDEIDRRVVPGGDGKKADWKPLVFLMTDGRPTDDPTAAISRWTASYARRVRLVALSVGGGADHAMLRGIGDDVVLLEHVSSESLARLFTWMSQSVAVHSQAIETGRAGGRVDLTKRLPGGAVSLDEPSPRAAGETSDETADEMPSDETSVDERVAVFVGRCQTDESPYLVRYERTGAGQPYRLRQALALSDTYFELSENEGRTNRTVGTGELGGMPACPRCGNGVALVACRCGGLHCLGGAGTAVCPWCYTANEYVAAPAGAEIDFSRGAG